MTRAYKSILLMAGALAMLGCGSHLLASGKGADVMASEPVAAPIRVVCLVDFSRSTGKTRVVQPRAAAFTELLELIQRTGGELGVGIIAERSNQSLLRCRFEQRPLPLAGPPSTGGTTFDRARKHAKYLQALQEDQRRLEAWSAENQRRAVEFEGLLDRLLDRPVSASATDIFGAIQRASLILNEPMAGWRAAPTPFAILITDGQDNVHASYSPLPAGTRVILVNGSASVGALSSLPLTRVESLGAALHFVTSVVNKKGE